MKQSPLFNILNRVDSTNNYAMAKVHEGMARHGMAWFAREQTGGKGQRGKQWVSLPGSSIILSITLQPSTVFISNPFYLSAVVALACHEFLENVTGNKFYIKWPNDLYWRDRKTGGILIENNYSGGKWNWAVVGIGINVNQIAFETDLHQAVSLKQISGRENLDPAFLAEKLSAYIIEKYHAAEQDDPEQLLKQYNAVLYKKDQVVRLKKANAIFFTTIKEVNKFGQLVAEDTMQRTFNFGEVEWMPELR
jgi:BirA family biotin operon repressor/biotin-[acetyl-CoA-carboxylase] ligase